MYAYNLPNIMAHNGTWLDIIIGIFDRIILTDF